MPGSMSLLVAALLLAGAVPHEIARAQATGAAARSAVAPPAPTGSAPIGARVRVRLWPDPADPYGSDRYAGTLARLDADSVVVHDGDVRRAWSRSRVRAMEGMTGAGTSGRTLGHAVLAGATIGTITGVVVGIATAPSSCGDDTSCETRLGNAMSFGLGYGMIGGVIGLLRVAFTSDDGWRPLAMRVPDVPIRIGVRTARVSFTF